VPAQRSRRALPIEVEMRYVPGSVDWMSPSCWNRADLDFVAGLRLSRGDGYWLNGHAHCAGKLTGRTSCPALSVLVWKVCAGSRHRQSVLPHRS